MVRSRDARSSSLAVESTDAGALTRVRSEPVPVRTLFSGHATPVAVRRRTARTRAGLTALALVALMLAAILTWSLRTGALPWAPALPSPVMVTSDPAGAPVAIDGVRMGVTPVTATLAGGSHTVVVGADDRAQTQMIEVRPGAETAVHFALAIVPTAEPVPAMSELVIATDPPGAEVTVDGVARGVSPLTLDELEPGLHEVTVTRDGTTVSRTVEAPAGTPASVFIALSASGIASGWLTVSSPVEADILDNGVLIGRTSTPRLLLPVGRHELDVVNEALAYRVRRTVVIAGGRTATLALEPESGRLNVNAEPWAEVWIDGARVGETPLANVTLPIGFHEVVLRHPQYGERRQTVAVGVGTPARVGVDLRP